MPETDTQSHNFGPDVHLVTFDDKRVFLVGTAHVSAASVALTEQVLREVRPECVAVELCEARFKSLRDPDSWKKSDIVKVFREGKSYVLLLQLFLANYQKKLGDQLNVRPGQEMLTAANTADELGLRTALIDRDVKVTLRRAWSKMGLWNVLKLIFASLFTAEKNNEVTEEEIERLKRADALDELMKEFSREFPDIRGVLIDERDRYMSEMIRRRPERTIVAIVGAGHVPGMKRAILDRHEIEPLIAIPPPSTTTKVIGWGLPVVFLGLLVWGLYASGMGTSLAMLEAWVWATGLCAAAGALLALSHPLTVLTAFVVAPITTLHPLLAAGWFAGLSEAIIRKPTVSDFESIVDDIGTVRGIYRNRISRILLTMVLTNLTATVGAIWGAKRLIELM